MSQSVTENTTYVPVGNSAHFRKHSFINKTTLPVPNVKLLYYLLKLCPNKNIYQWCTYKIHL